MAQIGYVYIVTSAHMTVVKVGCWKGEPSGLRGRYVSTMGSSTMRFLLFETKDHRHTERVFHKQFNKKCVENELYPTQHLDDYISFLSSMCDRCSLVKGLTMALHKTPNRCTNFITEFPAKLFDCVAPGVNPSDVSDIQVPTEPVRESVKNLLLGLTDDVFRSIRIKYGLRGSRYPALENFTKRKYIEFTAKILRETFALSVSTGKTKLRIQRMCDH